MAEPNSVRAKYGARLGTAQDKSSCERSQLLLVGIQNFNNCLIAANRSRCWAGGSDRHSTQASSRHCFANLDSRHARATTCVRRAYSLVSHDLLLNANSAKSLTWWLAASNRCLTSARCRATAIRRRSRRQNRNKDRGNPLNHFSNLLKYIL